MKESPYLSLCRSFSLPAEETEKYVSVCLSLQINLALIDLQIALTSSELEQ